MKSHYMSDIHLEFGPLPELPEGDVLILAGDITVQKRHWDWIEKCTERFDSVIYTLGNHEHYWGGEDTTQDYQSLIDGAREHFDGYVHFLENDWVTVDIGGVQRRFLGCTLWSDFDGRNPASMELAERGMNDYRLIKHNGDVNYGRFRPVHALAKHNESVQFLRENLREGDIVVTHMAPSFQSCDSRYSWNGLDGAYASNLEALILTKKPSHWIHGHIHTSRDYMIGDTRILCNPRGYYRHEENPDFNINASFEV